MKSGELKKMLNNSERVERNATFMSNAVQHPDEGRGRLFGVVELFLLFTRVALGAIQVKALRACVTSGFNTNFSELHELFKGLNIINTIFL